MPKSKTDSIKTLLLLLAVLFILASCAQGESAAETATSTQKNTEAASAPVSAAVLPATPGETTGQ